MRVCVVIVCLFFCVLEWWEMIPGGILHFLGVWFGGLVGFGEVLEGGLVGGIVFLCWEMMVHNSLVNTV